MINSCSFLEIYPSKSWYPSFGSDSVFIIEISFLFIITRSCWGGILVSLCPDRPSVRPSIRPTSGVRSVAPTVLFGSISYLHISLSNFRRCVTCKVYCKIFKLFFLQFFKICNFDFVLFWLGIWCESLVWVIMGPWRVSQNAGILVVLVHYWDLWLSFIIHHGYLWIRHHYSLLWSHKNFQLKNESSCDFVIMNNDDYKRLFEVVVMQWNLERKKYH